MMNGFVKLLSVFSLMIFSLNAFAEQCGQVTSFRIVRNELYGDNIIVSLVDKPDGIYMRFSETDMVLLSQAVSAFSLKGSTSSLQLCFSPSERANERAWISRIYAK